MDLFRNYGLRRVINSCGKVTHLAGAKVHPDVIEAAAESMKHFFILDELQGAAGQVISRATGAEWGCVTACTSAGITLGVAASMTGISLPRVLQLPDTSGMSRRVLIQKGHCVNYGHPITQSIRLSGAVPIELGSIGSCTPDEIRYELERGDVAAIVHVESHHTVQYGWVKLPQVVSLAHEFNVPVIVDAAAQDLRLQQLVGCGSDLVLTSAHKFLSSTTGGIVAGRRGLVNAVYLQNKGIGRPMKAGKEAIIGAMAALEHRIQEDIPAWSADQDRKVQMILDRLADIPGLTLNVDPDPGGSPFSRVRLTPDPNITGCSAAAFRDVLAAGDPAIVLRAHHVDEGYVNIDAIEMTHEEIEYVCAEIRRTLSNDK